MRVSGRTLQNVQHDLLDAFNRFSLRQMLRFELDEHLYRVAEGETLEELVFSLLEWAERTDRVAELIAGAHAFNPSNQRLRALAEEFCVAQTTPLPDLEFDWVVVRAGEFLMGSDQAHDPQASPLELPLHEVELSVFRIGRTPVTVAQYEQFVDATGYRVPRYWANGQIPVNKADHPVMNVSFEDALAFCSWAGVRLPSAAEWEKAARGTHGRIYPWGNAPPDCTRANYGGCADDTTPVDACPAGASPYGCLDMAGNLWEWTSTIWGTAPEMPDFPYPYVSDDGREQLDANARVRRVLKGGAYTRSATLIRSAYIYRSLPDNRRGLFGFRVADS